MRLRSLAAIMSVTSLGVAQAVTAAAAPAVSDGKITICHRTNAMSNPYRVITVDQSAADGRGGKGDHYLNHTGVVWTPEADKKEGWGDIIPPIPGVHAGRNWTLEGQSIWLNGCRPLSLYPVVPGVDTDRDGDPDVTDLDDDGDEIPDTLDPDDDGDNIPDLRERDSFDPDGDNVPSSEDPDDDGDGVTDVSDPDDDNDGVPDVTDPDDDGDGIPDVNDSDPDGDDIPSSEDPDDDNDGIPDVNDTDDEGDGIDDASDPDDDNDGVVDDDAPDQDDDGVPDIVDPDDDGDDIPDPRDRDRDEDNIPNKTDPDDDGDDIRDTKDPSNPATEVLVIDEEDQQDPRGWREVLRIDPGRPAGTGPAGITVKISCTRNGKVSASACEVRIADEIVRVRAACNAGPIAKITLITRANNARPSTVTKTVRLGAGTANAAGEVSPQACRF